MSACLLLSQAQEDENSQAQSCHCLHASQVSEEFSVFTGTSDFFFSWHVQPLFLGVESLFVFEEQQKRRAGGYLTQLRSEHLFQLLFLGCKCLCSHFFFSLKFSFSSLCVSNTVLASCNKIDLGQRKNPWRCGAVISGASGDGCSGADVVRARPPPTTAPHHWWFW